MRARSGPSAGRRRKAGNAGRDTTGTQRESWPRDVCWGPAVLDISLKRDVTEGTIPPPPFPDRLLFTLGCAERSPSRRESAGRPAGAIRALVHACERGRALVLPPERVGHDQLLVSDSLAALAKHFAPLPKVRHQGSRFEPTHDYRYQARSQTTSSCRASCKPLMPGQLQTVASAPDKNLLICAPRAGKALWTPLITTRDRISSSDSSRPLKGWPSLLPPGLG